MNLGAVWHDLECGSYHEDLPLWRELARHARGAVLDVGAGTGRVTLDLARHGSEVIALDVDAALLDALAVRAQGLPVETLLADARAFVLARRVSLVVAPMQTLQLLGGASGRAAFLGRALEHLARGGRLVAALADPLDCFDDEHVIAPPPDVRDVLGVRYSSQLVAVSEQNGSAAIRRRREILAPKRHEAYDAVVTLDRVCADAVAEEGAQVGFLVEPHLSIPETEEYLGSTVVVLRAP
jgi:SAM-dependent methyltransferase